MSLNKGMMSSNKSDWCTPAKLLESIRKVGPIDLDPCSNPHSIVNATRSFSLENGDDGLAESWKSTADGLVYVNPPYGRNVIDKWVEKANKEHLAERSNILMLVPARTDTKWFHEAYGECKAVCLLRGRLRFVDAPSGAPFPSALILWTNNVEISKRFYLQFDISNMVFEGRGPQARH